mgnify:CR=1 FL=1|tara:strand:+ start:720 stop:914 length:195 start_codon:yes stop_codon:yes gene_type:complete
MEITLTKKFKENYGKNKSLDTNPFKLKPLRPFGGRPKKEVEIKNKEIKSYNNMRKDGFYKLDFK